MSKKVNEYATKIKKQKQKQKQKKKKKTEQKELHRKNNRINKYVRSTTHN